jgi:hypothetical protein
MHYRVLWQIDIEAGSPEQAARHALEIQRKHDSIATVFDVLEVDSSCVRVISSERIDLTPEEEWI